MNRSLLALSRPLLCMCIARGDEGEPVGWRPCPSSLCDRPSHRFAHRVFTSARDYRYGGFRVWLRWVIYGVSADAEED